MAEDALEVVTMRNAYYRDSYKRVLMAILLLLVLNGLLIAVIVYQHYSQPEPKYFATSTDGRITPIYPLTRPVVSASALLQWANQAAVAAYSYNFSNYRTALQEASEYFTPKGWKDFQAALKTSGNLETVIGKKLVVSAVATGAPVIIEQGLLRGRYAWKVQMPILVNYESANTSIQDTLVVTLLITRVSPLQVPKGIAISQYIAAPAGGGTAGLGR